MDVKDFVIKTNIQLSWPIEKKIGEGWKGHPLLKGRQILIDFELNSNNEDMLLENVQHELIKRVEKTNTFGNRLGM